jgi:hypothetical protein
LPPIISTPSSGSFYTTAQPSFPSERRHVPPSETSGEDEETTSKSPRKRRKLDLGDVLH